MKLTSFPRLLTLGLCSAFIMASCSDDESVTDKNTTVKDEVLDDMQYSDESLISYIMSQFAELDENGNLVERTTYFRQLDESDTTAIYTIAESKESARAKFLSLLPETYQKKVVVKNDSSEMSLPIGTTPLQISYKEGGTDGNVVATVQLPSQGSYTKIANTLTMVKSLGMNWDPGEINNYLGKVKLLPHYVLTSSEPLPIDCADYFNKSKKMDIVQEDLPMLCYNVTPDGVAQYFYVPVLAEGTNQVQLKDGKYLVPGVYANLLREKGAVQNIEKFDDVLPSPKQVEDFLYNLSNFHNKNYYKNQYKLSEEAKRDAEDLLSKSTDKLTEDEKLERKYWCALQKLMGEETVRAGSQVEPFYIWSTYFPHHRRVVKDYQFVYPYKNYQKSPQIPLYFAENEDLPFFGNCEEWQLDALYEADDKRLEVFERASSIATRLVYGRDAKREYYIMGVYNSAVGEWSIIGQTEEVIEMEYLYFFGPVYQDRLYLYARKGRSMKQMGALAAYPLRIVYLYEEKLK